MTSNELDRGIARLCRIRTHPTFLERFKCEFKSENGGRNWGMLFSSKHFEGKEGACWSSRMGIRKNDKWVNYSHTLAQTKQQVG